MHSLDIGNYSMWKDELCIRVVRIHVRNGPLPRPTHQQLRHREIHVHKVGRGGARAPG